MVQTRTGYEPREQLVDLKVLCAQEAGLSRKEQQRFHTAMETARVRSNGYVMTKQDTSTQCVSSVEGDRTMRLLLRHGSKAVLIGLILKTSSIACQTNTLLKGAPMCRQRIPRSAEKRADLACRQLVCGPKQVSRIIAMSSQMLKIRTQRTSSNVQTHENSQGESNHTPLQTFVGIKLLPPKAICIRPKPADTCRKLITRRSHVEAKPGHTIISTIPQGLSPFPSLSPPVPPSGSRQS